MTGSAAVRVLSGFGVIGSALRWKTGNTTGRMPPVIGLAAHLRAHCLWGALKCQPRNHAGGE